MTLAAPRDKTQTEPSEVRVLAKRPDDVVGSLHQERLEAWRKGRLPLVRLQINIDNDAEVDFTDPASLVVFGGRIVDPHEIDEDIKLARPSTEDVS